MTIKEIALKAGVSIGTVDRVIHNRGRVSEETTQRVKKIIEGFGYKPNLLASTLSSTKSYQFGILMPRIHQDSNYWSLPQLGIKSAVKELGLYNIKIKFFFFDKYDNDSFEKVCNEIIRSDIKGLLMAPVLTELSKDFIKNNLSKEIPLILFDSDLPETDYLSFIGQDSFQSGLLSAKLMSLITKNEGTIAVIRVSPGDYHIRERAKGFISYFESNNNMNCTVFDIENNYDQKTFNTLLDDIIKQHNNLSGIFVTNDSTHYAAKYLSENVKEKINLIGYDLIDKNVMYLKRNLIDFLISQRPFMQGYQGVYTLFRSIVLKEKIKKKIMMPIDIITKENIDYYQLNNG